MAFFDMLQITQNGAFGDIEIMATFEEVMTDNLKSTENPVAANAPMTDHAYILPSEVLIKCGWSNSTIDNLIGAAKALFNGDEINADYVGGIYSQLLALQQTREPFVLTTSMRQYQNMLIKSLRVDRDQRTNQVLMVTAVCHQVLIAYTQATTLPARDLQSTPQSTATELNTGTKQVKQATPSPGGAIEFSDWLQ